MRLISSIHVRLRRATERLACPFLSSFVCITLITEVWVDVQHEGIVQRAQECTGALYETVKRGEVKR